MFTRLQSLPISTRVIAVSLTAIALIVTVNYVVFIGGYRDAAESAMVEKAAAFTAVADQTKTNTSQQMQAGSFDTENLISTARKALADGHNYRDTQFFRIIPVVAGWLAAEQAAKDENLQFRVVSFNARNPEHEPPRNSFTDSLLKDLDKQLAAGGSEIIHRIDSQANTLHYLRAIRLTDDCMSCHGQRGNKWDTDGDGKDVLGFAMEGWKTGDHHGAYEVIMPLDTADAQVAGFITHGLMWIVPLGALTVFLFSILMRRILGQPISLLVNSISDIQKSNDLTRTVDLHRSDEIGLLAKAFNGLIGTLRNVIKEVVTASNEVAAASTEIAATSEQMASTVQQQTRETAQISSAMEEMSSAVVEVARRSADASDTAQNAGKQAQEGGHIVEQTIQGMQSIADVVTRSSNTMERLNERSQQISHVIDLITEIADQTTLLALNAAIEAARAGKHGAGFAVVADEVRKLADRTMTATDEVTQAIKAMQGDTTEAVSAMTEGTNRVTEGVKLAGSAGQALQSIVAGSKQVATLISAIATASEEQTATAEEISRNVDAINTVGQQSAQGAAQASEAADMLSRKAEQLQALVSVFRI